MSKLKMFALSLLVAVCANSYAQTKSIVLTAPADYLIMAISPNGKWACGDYVDYSNASYAFLWNLQSGDIKLLSSSQESQAYSVSNDGVVSGTFADPRYSKNGSTISMPGYYKDGEWHGVELPAGMEAIDGMGYGITPDGQYMSGYIFEKTPGATSEFSYGYYIPYIWKNGKVYKKLGDKTAMLYGISPDGQSATGWEYGPKNNRIPTYWKADGTKVYMTDFESPFSSGVQFSPNGKKILFFGGWDENSWDDLKCIYDVETGEITKLHTIVEDTDMRVTAISNNYTVVGSESYRAFINVDGQSYYIEDYLQQLGLDLNDMDVAMYPDNGKYAFESAHAISEDDSAIGILYFDKNGYEHSMVVMPNRELACLAPVTVKAEQVPGAGATCLTWTDAVGSKTIKGYNVYRDGVKQNTELLSDKKYYDRGLSYDTFGYVVSAVYEDGTEVKADAVSITLAAKEISKPQAVFARQKGMGGSFVQWEAPATNLIGKTYVDVATANINSFGVNGSQVVDALETAINFPAEEIACYSGSKLTHVAFYPMSEQKSWTVNVYTRNEDGTLKRLARQTVTQELAYRTRNNVKLDTPVDLPKGDLIIGVEVTLATQSVNIIGMDFGNVTPGYTDLLRLTSEPDFYSVNNMNVEHSGVPYPLSWMMDATFTPEGAPADVDVIDHYNVYADNNKVGETKGQTYEVAGLADGTHVMGVDVVYANGKSSAIATGDVDIAHRVIAVDNVGVTNSANTEITANWNAPVDNDDTEVTYALGEAQSGVLVPGGYNMMAGAIYLPSMIKGYNGYKIKSFRFYPIADALFTFYLVVDGETVCEVEVSDYELNQWNTVELPEPVTIDESSEYMLALDLFDAVPNSSPLAMDRSKPNPYYSDLVSLDDGGGWRSAAMETGLSGSWLMGFVMATPEGKTLDVDGYDVVIDGTKKNTDKVKATNFVYDFGAEDAKQHSVRVDVYYPAKTESVEGGVTYFYIGAAGIGKVGVATISLRQGDNFLKVEGDGVKGLEAYTANGMKVAAADGDTMNLAGIASGVYVVKVQTANGTITRKIKVVK